MKKKFILLLFILIMAACKKETLSTDFAHDNNASIENISADLRGNKVEVCHKGSIISVSINALRAHQAHGDAIDLDGDGYFGIWQGEGTDTDGNQYELTVNLSCDFSGGIVVYEFTGGSCTGMLSLESQSGNTFTYSEMISLGCINNCVVEIEVLDGKINFSEDCDVAIVSGMLSLN